MLVGNGAGVLSSLTLNNNQFTTMSSSFVTACLMTPIYSGQQACSVAGNPNLTSTGSSSGSSFDPTSLLASIASLTTTVNSLQVNLTNAQAACSAAG